MHQFKSVDYDCNILTCFLFSFVQIDNSLWSLPVTLNNDKLKMFQSGRSVVIETDFGLTVRYDWEHYLVVTLSGSYAGKTCGLCGNFNDNPNDDFRTPSGSQAGGPWPSGAAGRCRGWWKALCVKTTVLVGVSAVNTA